MRKALEEGISQDEFNLQSYYIRLDKNLRKTIIINGGL
jgi:hypothetical protein